MMSFYELPPPSRGLLCLLCFFTVLLYQYGLLRTIRRRQKRVWTVCAAVLNLACYALFQGLLGSFSLTLNAGWTASLLILLAFAAIQIAWLSHRFSTEHIEAASIKESVDALPVGVCCYWQGGLVKLMNGRMDALCYAVTGDVLLNGERLWHALTCGEGRCEYLQTGENPVVRMSDGRIWSVRREDVELDGDVLYELLAVEMTDEYAANAELLKKQERVSAFNRRLRELNREIERMTVEKEVLAAKVSVHDDLGHALLYAKQYYKNPAAEDRETLLRIWGDAIRFVRNEGPEHWRDLYAYAAQAAAELGVAINVDGALPKGGRAEELFSDTLITCLSNAARHGGADALFVTAREGERAYCMRVTNNGTVQDGAVEETGGLRNLREKIEGAGGTMRVENARVFSVNVELPKEETEDGIPGADRG